MQRNTGNTSIYGDHDYSTVVVLVSNILATIYARCDALVCAEACHCAHGTYIAGEGV